MMFLSLMNEPSWLNFLRNAEDGGSGGSASDGEVDAVAAMYPDDPAPDASVSPASAEEGQAPENLDASRPAIAPDGENSDGTWAEFVADPAKSDAENAAAKVEHDKTKPADDTGDGEWKEYVPDPAKTDEENEAAKLENDLKHPINQVPENGEYQLTMPDGVELDTALMGKLGPVMSELNLSNGHAQQLVDQYIEHQIEQVKESDKQWAETVSGWAEEAKADPEMGGAKWNETVALSTGLVNRFGTEELTNYFTYSGAGNHPEMIRFMAKVGAMIGDDNPAINESNGEEVVVDDVARLYPDDKPKG